MLRYFSRDDFHESPGAQYTGISETNIIQSINATPTQTLLISGPGGSGKTRLAHHICQSSAANLAVEVDPNAADYVALYRILQNNVQNIRHIIFFIDYAENFLKAGPLCSFRELAFDDFKIQSTIVLSSRSSGVPRALASFPDIEIAHLRLDLPVEGATITYEDWLVRKILSYFDLGDNEDLAQICRGIPFLAAFSGFLATQHPEKFRKQFSQLGDCRHLGKWVRQRMTAFEPLGSRAKRTLTELCLALPFYGHHDRVRIVDSIDEMASAVLEMLEADRWVELESDGQLRIVHDSLADAIITEHVFNHARPTKRVWELFSTAARAEYLGRALRVMDRVITDENREFIDPLVLFRKLGTSDPTSVTHCALDIVGSSLVSPLQIPDLIEAISPLYHGLSGDRDAYPMLTRIAADSKHNHKIHLSQETHPTFFALLNEAAERPEAYVLANLLLFSASDFRDQAYRYITKNMTDYDTAFVMTAYLRAVKNPAPVGPFIVRWLERHRTSQGAGYVFTHWSDAIDALQGRGVSRNAAYGLCDQIYEFLEEWCSVHQNDQYAARCLQVLIDRRNLNIRVRRIVENWLVNFGDHYMAGHVVTRWIRKQKTYDAQSLAWALDWLNSDAAIENRIEASYLVKTLKDSVIRFGTGKFEDFSNALLRHIELDGPIKARRDLSNYWLELGGDPGAIKDTFHWLVRKEPEDPMTRFAFQSWHYAHSSDPFLFEREMEIWLNANAKNAKASYIFNIWDELGLDVKRLVAPLRIWLENNREDIQYHIQVKKYIAADPEGARSLGPTEEQALIFLSKSAFGVQDCRDIEYILQAPYATDPHSPLHERAVNAADRFLRTHAKKSAGAFLIALLIRQFGDATWIAEHADIWLGEFDYRGRANLVFQALLENGREPSELESKVKNWLRHNPKYRLAGRLFLAWAEAGGDPSDLRSQALVWLKASRDAGGFPDGDSVIDLYLFGPE